MLKTMSNLTDAGAHDVIPKVNIHSNKLALQLCLHMEVSEIGSDHYNSLFSHFFFSIHRLCTTMIKDLLCLIKLPFAFTDPFFLFFPHSLPQKADRPLYAANNAGSTEKYPFEGQSYATGQQHASHLDGYELEDGILCDNMDDDESNHSYVFLQQQQHYTPPPVEFQEGATPQHQSLIKKGSIMRNNPELMKRNRQNNS